MPLRKVGNDRVRDPYQPGSADYVAHPDSVRRVLSWYEGDRFEYPERSGPDGWFEYKEDRKDNLVSLLVCSMATDACVEVTYTAANNAEFGYQARALPPEEAYQLALDRDEWARGRGERIFNERHPPPEPPQSP